MTEDKDKVNEQLENETTEMTDQHEESHESRKDTKKGHKKTKAEEQLEKAESDLMDLKDRHIRLQAEFDNYRKRTLKERIDLMKTANESLLISLLPVIDDFDRANQTLDLVEEENPVKEGVKLIYNKFQEFLKQNGVKEIEAKGLDFDTDLHEAITKIPAPTPELTGKIVDVVQKGYYLNDKVIRFAKVVIGE
ncbi:MAG TPA: nucleotide exchange factor GrpE [Prolixibacteraceae bacterium]|nr:nucleotide exchange factor GrpE [Prolixibacteraceae bacterium]